MNAPASGPSRLTTVQWLVCGVAALGFAFDTYELLMMPIVARPALTEFLQAERPSFDPSTPQGSQEILTWTSRITYASAICGGIFGLLGGYLTDRFGRKKILFLSIMLYALSPCAAGFSTSPMMLLILRCTTFIGVCVEFVAAVAWLAELFTDPHQRERVLGYTQAFASIGGLMVSGMYLLIIKFGGNLPAIFEAHAPWRYLLISGLIPAIPLIVLLPFLPESPAWLEKKRAGTLKRTSPAALFQPLFRRTTLVTTLMFACTMGAAFGAIQLTPQIVSEKFKEQAAKLKQAAAENGDLKSPVEDAAANKEKLAELGKERESAVGSVQLYQELGGLAGRCVLAVLAGWIVSRRRLLRVFQWPGLVAMPVVFAYLAVHDLEMLKWGIAIAGFFTVAQMSFWGNYLPRVYPTHLRGTGEGFAANVGGRMLGTGAQVVTTLITPLIAFTPSTSNRMAYAAAIVGFGVYLIGTIACFWLPEPKTEELPE